MRARRADLGGFTLFEVLGVVVITAIVIGFTSDYYIELSRASNRASENTREIRRATAILDRMARDFDSTLLVTTAAGQDSLENPWLFVGEDHGGELGADHVKFVTRNSTPRHSGAHESDLLLVAYTVEENEDDGTLDLYRWTANRLPESLDRSFPASDDEASVLMGEGIAAFGVTFFDESGAPTTEWDSTMIVESGALPESVEISLVLADPLDPDAPVDLDEATIYRRRIRLPLRPLDLQLLTDPEQLAARRGEQPDDESSKDEDGEDGEDGPPSGLTVADCINIPLWMAQRNAEELIPGWSARVQASANLPWETARHMFHEENFAAWKRPNPDCVW